MPLALLLALAAAPADIERCHAALMKVRSHDDPERIDAFQACGRLLGDQALRNIWYSVVHSSPFEAAPILAMAAGDLVPHGAPNACVRSKSDLPICKAPRDEVLRLKASEKADQWRSLFIRLLGVDLPPAQAAVMERAFLEKWPLLFPDPQPPTVSQDGPLKISGNIDRSAVMRGIAGVRLEMIKCLAAPQADLTIVFTVNSEGKVTRFGVLQPNEPERQTCLSKAFQKAQMPRPIGGGAAIVTWTSEYDD